MQFIETVSKLSISAVERLSLILIHFHFLLFNILLLATISLDSTWSIVWVFLTEDFFSLGRHYFTSHCTRFYLINIFSYTHHIFESKIYKKIIDCKNWIEIIKTLLKSSFGIQKRFVGWFVNGFMVIFGFSLKFHISSVSR